MITISEYAKMQKEKSMPCPRCGSESMRSPVHTNALSRHEDIYICSECGTDEAIRDYFRMVLPIDEWAIMKGDV